MESFNQTLPNIDILKQCLTDYQKYGNECTVDTTSVPFTTIGKFGIFDVCVRYSKTFNCEPSWTYSLQSGGSMITKSGFGSLQEAIDACILVAEEDDREFEAKYGDIVKEAKERFGSTLKMLNDDAVLESDKFVILHDKFKSLLDEKDFKSVNGLMKLFCNDKSSVGTLKTILLITKAFKNNEAIGETRKQILELCENKLGKEII